jgi:hypothetical protein
VREREKERKREREKEKNFKEVTPLLKLIKKLKKKKR